ncbi:MAG: sugar phosphate isomerase/epimerase [Planctomycetaceae bacterium]|nr:sugar phosphate isomerase/epimerase [Planctomycetales bacterium]MCB9923441.1 sugar phosphate isomerase/epimerase [Planctomycetaceae bacterium]
MLELKIGIQLASLKLPFKKALHIAGELGANGVEIDARNDLKPQDLSRTGLRQLRKSLDDRNLRVCAVGFQTRRGYDVLQDLDRRVEATKQAMQFAYDLGASVVINQVGQIPAEPTGPRWDLLIQVLTDLGRFGQRTGAMLAVETGAEDAETLLRLIEALPDGSVGINLDPGNLIVNGYSASEAARMLGKHVLHVHAKDGVRDLAQGRGLETQLGRGAADFPEILGILEEHEYRGYFTIERQHADQPLVEIGQAVQYLRSLV